MVNTLSTAVLALLVDWVVGDPVWLPHPVVMMGRMIRGFERRTNHWQTGSALSLRWRGTVLTLTITVSSALITAAIWMVARRVSPILGVFVDIWMISTTIAWKGLVKAGQDVYRALTTDGIDGGRRSVGMIVGRDTESMDEQDVVRATVETLAENIVDAIVSPVFYAILGAAPLAMVYRAANTLDSMVGYRNDRYMYFGFASARLDDMLNYVPARLTVVLIYLVIWFRRGAARTAWRIMLRDARKHPSPNSGLPEAMVAGALAVQLGGKNQYGGITSFRAHLGDPVQQLTSKCILQSIRIVKDTSWLLFTLVALGGGVIWFSSVG